MFNFIIVVHILVCILLALIILMQSGRGGGLTEGFAAAESMFGAKTNVVLVRATTVLASLFLSTCLSLAFLSTQKSKSLIPDKPTAQSSKTHSVGIPSAAPVPTSEASKEVNVPQPAAQDALPVAQPNQNSEEKGPSQQLPQSGETTQP